MVGPPPGLPRRSGTDPWRQNSQGTVGSSEPMEDTDSTEVKYKIRQWSLPGAAIVPVLNVSSRVFWLELDDKALLDSFGVLQEQEGSGDLQEGHPSVTKGASPSAKHPLKVPFTKA